MPALDNLKHETFCHEYLKDLNGTAAYLRTYRNVTKKTAKTNASKLLSSANIMRRIKELMGKRQYRTDVTADMVVTRLAAIAFGSMGDIARWGENGVEFRDSEELTDDEKSIIDFIRSTPVGDGNGSLLGYNKSIKLKDSLRALELLGRHLGLFDGNGTSESDSTNAKERLSIAIRRFRERLTNKERSDKDKV